MEYALRITRTKSGLPAVAETGISGKTKGMAWVFCRDNGSKKTATYLPRPEEIETVGHAVFVLQKNDYCIAVERSRTTTYSATIAQFTGIINDQEQAIFEIRHSLKSKKWDVIPPEYLLPVVEAAKEKSHQETPEVVWYEKKQPFALVEKSDTEAGFSVKPGELVPSFLGIQELRQIAANEFSVCFTNGVQLLVYVKECQPKRAKG